MTSLGYLPSPSPASGFSFNMPFSINSISGLTVNYKGLLDNFALYNRALAPQEMLQNTDAPTVLPRALFDFDNSLNSDYGGFRLLCNNASSCPIYSTNAVAGRSLVFSGLTCLSVGPLPMLNPFDPTKSFTVSLWVSPESAACSGFLFGSYLSNYLSMSLVNGTARFVVGGQIVGFIFQDTRLIPNNTWTHLVFGHVRLGTISFLNIYVNGIGLYKQFSGLLNTPSAGMNISLGCLTTITSFFVGKMDQLAIYSSVLLGPDITLLNAQYAPSAIAASLNDCDFDSSSCGWVNGNSTTGVWQRWSGPSQSPNQGPLGDVGTSNMVLPWPLYYNVTGNAYEYVNMVM